jgi:hypothetical protein
MARAGCSAVTPQRDPGRWRDRRQRGGPGPLLQAAAGAVDPEALALGRARRPGLGAQVRRRRRSQSQWIRLGQDIADSTLTFADSEVTVP